MRHMPICDCSHGNWHSILCWEKQLAALRAERDAAVAQNGELKALVQEVDAYFSNPEIFLGEKGPTLVVPGSLAMMVRAFAEKRKCVETFALRSCEKEAEHKGRHRSDDGFEWARP